MIFLEKNLTKEICSLINEAMCYEHSQLEHFLSDVFDDLTLRSGESSGTISKFCFNDYLRLPLVITNRIFNLNATDEKMNKANFLNALLGIYSGDLNSRVRLLFTVLDNDQDGQVELEDIRFILSQFHMIKGKYDDHSLTSLIKDISKCLGQGGVSFEKFSSASNSDLILLFLYYFSYYTPFDKETLELYGMITKECHLSTRINQMQKFPQPSSSSNS